MPLAFGLLLTIALAAPIAAVFNDALVAQLLSLASIATLVTIGVRAATSEFNLAARLCRPLLAAIIFPALWMSFQLVPLPKGSFDHPIWAATASALDTSLAGHITIDIGHTVSGLLSYLSFVILALATVVITRSRDEAHALLAVLSSAITLVALLWLTGFLSKSTQDSRQLATTIAQLCAMGLIANIVSLKRIVEYYQRHRSSMTAGLNAKVIWLALYCAGALICLTAMAQTGNGRTMLAAMCGTATIFMLLLFRGFGLRPLPAAVIAVAILVITLTTLFIQFGNRFTFATLLGVQPTQADMALLLQRMIGDTGFFGTGAGTFSDVASIYRDTGTPAPVQAPSTLASMLVEWGLPATLIAGAFAVQIFAVMFSGALKRRRDSFFTIGAASIVVLTVASICSDTTVANAGVQALIAIILGLGLAQSKSRT